LDCSFAPGCWQVIAEVKDRCICSSETEPYIQERLINHVSLSNQDAWQQSSSPPRNQMKWN
jgi:hypothetical protein